VFEGVTLNGVAINSLDDAADAAQAFGPNGTIYRFDHNATLVVFEQNAFV
jgi:hypothetical protein